MSTNTVIAKKLRSQAANLMRMAAELEAIDNNNIAPKRNSALIDPATGKVLWTPDNKRRQGR
jgi:hypothetical protein